MWISYSDSEVNRFHPICERALNYALRLIGKDDQYRVLHHQYTGALEMDYVVQNIATGKYLCVVEVKRTPADVHSARYQFQAMSYVQMNAGQSEKPFYILTNLEYAFSFRYDAGRPRVFQQMLKPGLSHIGSFDIDDEEIFVEKLARYFSERLTDYTNNSYEYLVTLEEFASHMEHIKDEPKRWKTHLAALLYEYIKGNRDLVIIKLCVRMEAILKCDGYIGDFAEMLDKYCNEKLTWSEDDGWGYFYNKSDEKIINLLHKLRKIRNSLVHSEKTDESMSEDEIKQCIDYICSL